MSKQVRVLSVMIAVLFIVSLVVGCAPATPQVIEVPKEVIVEKAVIQTVVVEKEVAVEKQVVQTVVVEKQVKETVIVEKVVEKQVIVTPTPQAGAQRGGKVTYGQGGDIKNLDPFDMLSLNYPFFYNLYDSLIRYDNQLNIMPRLATSWVVDKDQTKITLNLRQGVKWHNGREFVADDVVKNFERGANDVKGLNVYGMLSPVFEKATAIDKYTVELQFKGPTPNLFDLLNAICMHAPESMDSLTTTAIGTGPFKLKEWIPGDHVTFVRFDDYWEEGKPYLDEWTIRPYGDYDALLDALEGGVVDIIYGVKPKDKDRLESAGKVLIPGQEGFIIYTVAINPPDSDMEQTPLADKRVRQAINYAMDRETIIEQALFGAGKRKVTHFPEWSIAYFEDLEQSYPFDLEKAKQLLTEAGYPNGGFTLNAILTPSDPAYEAWAVIHAADLKKLGIDVKIDVLDPATWTARRFGTKETNNRATYDLDYTGQGRQHLDPMGLWSNSGYRLKNSPIYPVEADWPEGFRELVMEAGSTVDKEKRRELFRKIVEIQLDQSVNVPLSWRYVFFGTQPYVHGVSFDVEDKIIMGDVWLSK